MAQIPHWQYPATFNVATGVGVVEQDTIGEVFANVQKIANCPVGACPEAPGIGVPSIVFGQVPLDPTPIVNAIQAQEPRATIAALSQAMGDADFGTWVLSLTTQFAGGDK